MSLDKSLDDLIPKKNKSFGGRGGGGAVRNNTQRSGQKQFSSNYKSNNNSSGRTTRGRGRRNNYNQNRANMDDQWTHNAYQSDDDHQQQHETKNLNQYGTKIRVSDLKFDVLEDELQELFGRVGKIHSVKVHYDKTGRSTGTADIVFKKQSDAHRAIREYDGRKIDGEPMNITEVGSVNIGEKNIIRKEQQQERKPRTEHQESNVFQKRNSTKQNNDVVMDEDSNFRVSVQF